MPLPIILAAPAIAAGALATALMVYLKTHALHIATSAAMAAASAWVRTRDADAAVEAALRAGARAAAGDAIRDFFEHLG
ncbi:hypothetical protein [Falsiroseomonas stagni]|jgi:hypothetical protein|uniref:Uncharacterized protein n=1 Tax=Falsiroseomonas stagni DSM 19981 TaxID=1123062 RepID=A0A1I4F8G3_9PROT|nr:hypothetical protein [Falsiroseomonas stagni]SFL13819.1 hypothetical protein SAMN02745775_1255 [Falsiroseomonas stagni DSM 19981]